MTRRAVELGGRPTCTQDESPKLICLGAGELYIDRQYLAWTLAETRGRDVVRVVGIVRINNSYLAGFEDAIRIHPSLKQAILLKAGESTFNSRGDQMSRTGKVLVVDDDQAFARMLNVSLENAGLKCQHVTNPLLVPSFVEGTKIDIVLVDVEMPELNGLQLLNRLKQLERPVEVIMVSGIVDESAMLEAYRQGAYGYCVKPICDCEQMVQLIESAFAKISHWDRTLERAEMERDKEPTDQCRLAT